jgi:hypothetical protein
VFQEIGKGCNSWVSESGSNSGDLQLNSRKHSKRLRDAEPRDINDFGLVLSLGPGSEQ